MLAVSTPRSPPRTKHAAPPISFTQQHRPSSSQSTISPLPTISSSSTPKERRPSISNTMHWLSRNSTQSTQSSSKTPYSPSKPKRISEPKLIRSIELISQRSGALGSGATVVRTPDEALKDSGVRLGFEGRSSTESARSQEVNIPPRDETSPELSPPLPPLPSETEDEESHYDDIDHEPEHDQGSTPPPRPVRAAPPPPMSAPASAPGSSRSSLRSSLKRTPPVLSQDLPHVQTQSQEFVTQIPPIPPLPPTPPNLVAPPPPFRAILVSDVPQNADRAKVVVILETCTTTYRTTVDTLTSRPSFLAEYITELLPEPAGIDSGNRERGNSVASSVYSTASDDMSAYRHHLADQGLVTSPRVSAAASNVHIFLDRPSAPYAHILTYLRTPPPSPSFSHPFAQTQLSEPTEILPRAVSLRSLSHSDPSYSSNFEALLELRDEAAFLGLEALHKLCMDELRLRTAPSSRPTHTRGQSSTSMASMSMGRGDSVHSMHASIYSSIHGMQPLLERVESMSASPRTSSTLRDSSGSGSEIPDSYHSSSSYASHRQTLHESQVRREERYDNQNQTPTKYDTLKRSNPIAIPVSKEGFNPNPSPTSTPTPISNAPRGRSPGDEVRSLGSAGSFRGPPTPMSWNGRRPGERLASRSTSRGAKKHQRSESTPPAGWI